MNFGVRYEFSTVPEEDHNLLGNFDPNSIGLVQVQTGTERHQHPVQARSQKLCARMWDLRGTPTGTGKTVLRGGMGLTYETVNWQSFIAFNNAFGPGSVPTEGIILGGTINTGNITVFPNFPWDNGPVYGNTTTIDLQCQSLPHHERGP